MAAWRAAAGEIRMSDLNFRSRGHEQWMHVIPAKAGIQ
jgi:hypothetical protein